MKDCYCESSANRLLSRALSFIVAVCLVMSLCVAPVFCYDINGTSTGNLLNNGGIAEADGFSVYTDTENENALIVETDKDSYVADANAQYVNICGKDIYYLSFEKETGIGSLRCFDTVKKDITEFFTVSPETMFCNLIIDGGKALMIKDGDVISYDLSSGKTTALTEGFIASFVPVKGGLVCLDSTTAQLSFRGENGGITVLAEDVLSYDCAGRSVYYSNGSDGVFQIDIDGSGNTRLADGGTNIICADGDVYWNTDGSLVSLNGDVDVSAEENIAYNVTDGTVSAVTEESAPLSSSFLSDSKTALPTGDYKNWKQSDSRWSGTSIGGSSLGRSGCLVTSIAMMLVACGAEKTNYLNGDFDPGTFARRLNSDGYFSGGGAINSYDFFKRYYGQKGLTFTDTRNGSNFGSLSEAGQVSAIEGHLNKEHFVIVCVNNPSTGNTHWVLVDRVEDGRVLICDPGYTSKTGDLFRDYPWPRVTRALIFSYSGTGWSASDYLLRAAAPTISVAAAGNDMLKVTIKTTSGGAKIYYTTNGSTPTQKSSLYTGPFTVKNGTTIKAIATGGTTTIQFKESIVTSYYASTWKNPFKDLSSSKWYYGAVAEACQDKLFYGTSSVTFSPEVKMTRAEFVCVIARLVDVDLTDRDGGSFKDVKAGSWYAPSVSWAADKGIVVGTSETTFSPNDPITREQACSIMIRLTNYLGITLTNTEAAVTFADASKISAFAKNDVVKAQRAGLIYGRTDGKKLYMTPQGNATRAEICSIIMRFIDKMPQSAV